MTFTAPGAGEWALDRSHFPGGSTPIAEWLMTESMPTAFRRVFREVGVPADTLDVGFVNGFMYTRLRPLIAPDKPSAKLPPAPILKLASRLHPGFRRANKAAAASLRDRPWRGVIERWNNSVMPEVRRKNLELQGVDLAPLDDVALAAHLDRLLVHARAMYELHFWLHGYDLGPVGMLLFDCASWGLAPTDVIPALTGASPSTVQPLRELAAIRATVEASGRTPTSVEELRAIAPDIDVYLQTRGSMVVSQYDLDGRTLGELPDVIVASVLNARVRPEADVDEVIGWLRARVPAAQRAAFDERLSEARSAMDLRDANGPMTAEWPVGLLRLALLHAGTRLVQSGRIRLAEHLFELRRDEVVGLVANGDGPTSDELVERATRRAERARLIPPPRLGPAELSPRLDLLPAALGRMVGAVQMVLAQLDMDGSGGIVTTDPLQGHGVGVGSAVGRVCKALSADEALGLMEPGDILLVPFTTPAYNTVLTLASAVVTSEGGPLCHAAVLARELGIPGVVGARGSLAAINHGDIIEVDAALGRVRLQVTVE